MSEHNGNSTSPPEATARNLRQLSHRLVTLTELQWELLKLDVQEGLHAVFRPVILLIGGVVLALASMPVLLLGVAHALREGAGLSWTVSVLIAAFLGIALSAAALLAGWKLAQKSLAVFGRTARELRANVNWLKAALNAQSVERRSSESLR